MLRHSFCRIDDKEIRLREPVLSPDALIAQDPALFQTVDVFQGLFDNGFVPINPPRRLDELDLNGVLGLLPPGHARCVPAGELARLPVGRPLPNAALLGGVAAVPEEM